MTHSLSLYLLRKAVDYNVKQEYAESDEWVKILRIIDHMGRYSFSELSSSFEFISHSVAAVHLSQRHRSYTALRC